MRKLCELFSSLTLTLSLSLSLSLSVFAVCVWDMNNMSYKWYMSATTKHNAQCENCKLKWLFVAAVAVAARIAQEIGLSGIRQAGESVFKADCDDELVVEPESRLQIESLFLFLLLLLVVVISFT